MGKSKKSKKYSSSNSEEEILQKQSQKVKSKKKNRSYSSSSSEEIISRKNKTKDNKKRKHRDEYSSSSNSDSSSDSSKEKNTYKSKQKCSSENSIDSYKSDKKQQLLNDEESKLQRDTWMNLQTKFFTTSNSDRKRGRDEQKRLDREKQQYDPSKCDMELNPYWKHGGDGLPTFKKPDNSDYNTKSNYTSSNRYVGTSNWRKKKDNSNEDKSVNRSSSTSSNRSEKEKSFSSRSSTSSNRNDKDEESQKDKTNSKSLSKNNEKSSNIQENEIEYTEKDLNNLAAKLVKAEIMGNKKLIQELKQKLEDLRNVVKSKPPEVDECILTQTDSKGQSKPLRLQLEYGESSDHKRKKKIETHQSNERVRYFADDDKYSLKQMFEHEKYNTGADQDKEFLKSFTKIRKNDYLDDIFTDNIRQKESTKKIDEKNKSKAISDQQKISQSLDNCSRCLQSESMLKHLMISMGDNVYLALPSFEPLTEDHSMIIPIRHTPCATQLDENEWSDILDVRRSLVKMFETQDKVVIFFECAMLLHKFPHMVIECIPVPREEGDMAPIYFKKAIDESEIEWSQNKKLVSLKGKDVRKAIPKGLSYFAVSFGMEEGFAHVIEDEQLFPVNFAQEIIGGMLDLHHSKWRKPKRQNFEDQSKKVMEFSAKWKDFDCFTNY